MSDDDDDIVSLRAGIGRLRAQLDAERAHTKALANELLTFHRRLALAESSTSYRVGRTLAAPLARVPGAEPAMRRLQRSVVPLVYRAAGAAKVAWRRLAEVWPPWTAPQPRRVMFSGEVAGLTSVVLPVDGADARCGEAARRALAQADGALELIIVVDGAPCDDLAAELTALIAADRRVRVLEQPRQGAAAALATGMAVARGERPLAARGGALPATKIGSARTLLRHRVELARAEACYVTDAALLPLAGLFHPQTFFAPGDAAARRVPRRVTPARPAPEVMAFGATPLHVLVQVEDFDIGGLEQVALDAARTLRELGARVTLLVLGRRGEAAARALAEDFDVRALPPGGHRALFAELGCDVVHAHFSISGVREAAAAGIPFVQTLHDTYVWLDRATIAAHVAAATHTAAYACVSRATALYAAQRLGLPAERMLVMPNGVDTARLGRLPPHARAAMRATLGLGAGEFAIVNAANILDVKAQLPLVDAFARILPRHPQARLLLAGRELCAQYGERIREAVRRHRCEHAVRWLGYRHDMPEIYGAVDAFVLPSFWEGDSLAAIEATCAGLPLVLSDAGSARELLAAVGGALVDVPYDSILDVRIDTIRRFYEDEGRLVRSLAAALDLLLASPQAPRVDAELRAALDRRAAYRGYLRLFRWLRQGGHPAALRAFTR